MKVHFSPSFKEVLSLSREEAIRLQSGTIGTGHLLLALIRQGDSNTVSLLQQATVSMDHLQKEIEAGIAREDKKAEIPAGKAMIVKRRLFGGCSLPSRHALRLTRDTEKAIRKAMVLVADAKSPLAGPEHLLLSILKDKDNWVAGTLGRYGLS